MRTLLPQSGVLCTEGPFRMLSIDEHDNVFFEPICDCQEDTTVINLSVLTTECGWTKEYFQEARRNMKYFLHTVFENHDPAYVAVTCWSEGRYTRLCTTPLLRKILDTE